MNDLTPTILPAARAAVAPLEDVFVSIDLADNIAYVAVEGETGISWDEVSRADGELLATLGAPAQIHLGSSARIGVTPTVRVTRRPV